MIDRAMTDDNLYKIDIGTQRIQALHTGQLEYTLRYGSDADKLAALPDVILALICYWDLMAVCDDAEILRRAGLVRAVLAAR